MSLVRTCCVLVFGVAALSPRSAAQPRAVFPDSSDARAPTSAADSERVAGGRTVPALRWYTPIANIPGDWERWWNISTKAPMVPQWCAIAGLSGALIVTDDATYSPSDRFYRSSGAARKWSDFFAEFGDGRSQFALAGSFGAYGLLFGDDKALRVGTQIVEVVIASGAVIQVLKHVTGRESPFVRTSPTGVWKPFPSQIDYHRHVPQHDAFPSGHICTSLATVIVLAENYPEAKWIRPLGYTLTTLVGVGMANNGIHWYSDYPLGLFIGYMFGMIAAHPEGLPGEDSVPFQSDRLRVFPTIQPDGAGVGLTLVF